MRVRRLSAWGHPVGARQGGLEDTRIGGGFGGEPGVGTVGAGVKGVYDLNGW